MQNIKPFVASVYVRYLPHVLAQSGYDPAPFLQRHRLTQKQLNQSNVRLDYKDYFAFIADVLAHTDIPGLGLKTANHINLLKQGLYGHAISCRKNLKQAFAIHANYFRLQSDIIPGSLIVDGENAHYSVNINLFSHSEAITRFEVEQDFAMWLKAAEICWEESGSWFQKIHFSTSRPCYSSIYKDFFQCPVEFNQPENRFFFNTKYLQRTFRAFDAQVMQFTEQQCSKLLDEQSQAGGMTGKINDLLSQCGNRIPSVTDTARQLNLSEITLRRRLKKEGTNYKTLVYQFRMSQASRYLLETHLTIKEIAYFTGYSDPANFTRAFIQFFSMPPQQYRNPRDIPIFN